MKLIDKQTLSDYNAAMGEAKRIADIIGVSVRSVFTEFIKVASKSPRLAHVQYPTDLTKLEWGISGADVYIKTHDGTLKHVIPVVFLLDEAEFNKWKEFAEGKRDKY